MFSDDDEKELRKIFSDAINKGVQTSKLQEKSYMEMITEIHRGCLESKPLWHDTHLYRVIRHKSVRLVKGIHIIKVFDGDMYVLVGCDHDLEFYYPNHDLFASSDNHLTCLSSGAGGYGISFPSYKYFEDKSVYFNYTIQSKALPVEYKFFDILRELHSKYVKNNS